MTKTTSAQLDLGTINKVQQVVVDSLLGIGTCHCHSRNPAHTGRLGGPIGADGVSV